MKTCSVPYSDGAFRSSGIAASALAPGIHFGLIFTSFPNLILKSSDFAVNRLAANVGLSRDDLSLAIETLEWAGYDSRYGMGTTMFLNGPEAKARDAIHVIRAGEKVRADDAGPAPRIDHHEWIRDTRILPFRPLASMKLTSFRDKDRVHLRDLISAGPIDSEWTDRLPPARAARPRELLENPDG